MLFFVGEGKNTETTKHRSNLVVGGAAVGRGEIEKEKHEPWQKPSKRDEKAKVSQGQTNAFLPMTSLSSLSKKSLDQDPLKIDHLNINTRCCSVTQEEKDDCRYRRYGNRREAEVDL